MVLIVEMFNGRPNIMKIMGPNEEGELVVKELITEGPPDPEYRKFSCSGFNWKKVLELGEKMGWKPSGSVLEKTLDSINPIVSDYKPSSWGDDDYKIFTALDASNLADSLERLLTLMEDLSIKEVNRKEPFLITSTMTQAQHKNINRDINKEFLKDFILFLRKGKFKFVWDD
jgi:hypothetical protein